MLSQFVICKFQINYYLLVTIKAVSEIVCEGLYAFTKKLLETLQTY